MELNKKSPQVVELVEKIQEVRQKESDKHLDYAVQLMDLAKAEGNEDLIDYASCILGDACVQNRDFMEGIYYLTQGISGLSQTDEYELICRCYNEIGVILNSQSHYIGAEEAYLNCINTARMRRMYFYEAMACANLASLCEDMGCYEDALQYRLRALEAFSLAPENPLQASFELNVYAYIVRLYVLLDNKDSVEYAYNNLQKKIEEYTVVDRIFETEIAKMYYGKYSGNLELANNAKQNVVEEFYKCDDFVVNQEEAMALFEYLMEEKDYETAEKAFEYFASMTVEEELVNQHLKIEEFRVRMYEDTGREKEMLESAMKCFELHKRKLADLKNSFKTTMRLQTEVVQQRTKNLFLSAAAETDGLTGLPNRSKLNTVIDELFVMASKVDRSLGVEMLDIDFFKEVNDTYGHKRGDEVLVEVAKILKKIESDNVFVARYGGDEFIIYYYNMTDEEIIKQVEYIQRSVEELRITMGFEKLSVSQGLVNHVPHELNRAWDYMMVADESLYYVKNHGKANARLVHSLSEVQNDPWNKIF